MNSFPITWTGAPGNNLINGLSWPVKRSPVFNTIIHRSSSGAVLTVPLYQQPLWHFELTYTAIPRKSPNPSVVQPPRSDVDIITAFWITQKGPAYPFLFEAPDQANAQLLTQYMCIFSDDNGMTLEDFTNTLTALQSLKLEQILVTP